GAGRRPGARARAAPPRRRRRRRPAHRSQQPPRALTARPSTGSCSLPARRRPAPRRRGLRRGVGGERLARRWATQRRWATRRGRAAEPGGGALGAAEPGAVGLRTWAPHVLSAVGVKPPGLLVARVLPD